MYEIELIRTQLEICKLKAQFLRLVDTKDWDRYVALLTEDFVLDISHGSATPVITGREAAVKQVRAAVENSTTVHYAHQPEFEFHGDEVQVIWAMHTRVVRGPDQPSHTLYGHHHDRWLRRNGQWKLASLRQTTLHLDVHAPTQR